ncbi:ABC transporter permease [Knoellia flava TL1]|uniref:ABC transporter permease n=2 Tax=Knoellia flava TaxID=913969 RepID=A0A8H9FTW9_9MICO|nr:ABC transporter permease subunit [Knoellia flava]KGN30588.1 ABC transporter permease [Knoellia flava TL1]GGB77178.1 ABC transporter permease [Knoellia flava]
MIASILEWLTSSATWSGEAGLGARIVEHLWYSLLAVVIAAAVAVPLGLWVGHTGRARWLVSLANSLRAVPTLGLLFAVALWLGPKISGELAFLIPSVVVLVILVIPPILSGVYAGVEAVDPATRDAARGMGMRGMEVVRQVEIPNALPLILSGLRSAFLQVIATATVAAYIGLGGLGRYLVDGIKTGDYVSTAGGAVVVSVLALLVDGVLALVQRLVVSPGLTGGRTGRTRRGRSEPTTASTSPTTSTGSSTRSPARSGMSAGDGGVDSHAT